MKTTILLGVIAVTIIGSFAVSGLFVQAGLEPIERIQVIGNTVNPFPNSVPFTSVASCPNTHPILIGGSYDIDIEDETVKFSTLITDFDVINNEFTVTITRFSTDVNYGITAHALCANVNFPMNMGMVGGGLLDINSVSLFVGAIGVNPIITGLVGITIAGVAGQAFWFVYRRKKFRA